MPLLNNGLPADRLPDEPVVAYFSMEIGLDEGIPTYGGGLGILAGDTLRAAADLGIPMVGVTLLHRQGYLRQQLDTWGNQIASDEIWYPEEHLQALTPRVVLTLGGRQVLIRAWRYLVHGESGRAVPVYFLDTQLHENELADRMLAGRLYGGDSFYRLCQEVVLGIGGIAMLRALGYSNVHKYHMNEGHSAFLALALLQEWCCKRGLYTFGKEGVEAVRSLCSFTTHTPVAAGHDVFPMEVVREVLGDLRAAMLAASAGNLDGRLSMSHLALAFSGFVNGVSQRHSQVCRQLYPEYTIDSITNGVHGATWTSPSFAALYDRHLPGWRRNNQELSGARSIPLHEIQAAHREAKGRLLEEVRQRTGIGLSSDVMTLGFARRAAAYKRADLLFTDLERLRRIAEQAGPFQVIYAGKAHPNDEYSQQIIRRVFQASDVLRDAIKVVFLENYNIALGRLLCAGADLWLNTPQQPLEASGTSGMKAALNGVPSLSVVDGWWVEGLQEGVTGWAIGGKDNGAGGPEKEAQALYDKLERVVLPLFYGRPDLYGEVMRSAMAVNGAYFNTHRMLTEYAERAYGLPGVSAASQQENRDQYELAS